MSDLLKALHANRKYLKRHRAKPETLEITDRGINRLCEPAPEPEPLSDAEMAELVAEHRAGIDTAMPRLLVALERTIRGVARREGFSWSRQEWQRLQEEHGLSPEGAGNVIATKKANYQLALAIGREVSFKAISERWDASRGVPLGAFVAHCMTLRLRNFRRQEWRWAHRRRPLPQEDDEGRQYTLLKLRAPPAERAIELQESRASAAKALAEFNARLTAQGSPSLVEGVGKGHARAIERAVRQFASVMDRPSPTGN
jgi:hypothetical protein